MRRALHNPPSAATRRPNPYIPSFPFLQWPGRTARSIAALRRASAMVSNHNSLALEKDVASKITFATRQCRTESHLSVNPPTTTPTTDQITSGRKDAEVGSGATRQPHPLDSISTDKTLDDNAWVHTLDATSAVQARPPIADHHAHSPSCAGLRVQTDLTTIEESARPSSGDSGHISSTPGLPIRTPSVKVALHASSNTGGSLSPSSTFSSPGLGPLVAITPLPSPIVLSGSSGLWRKPEDRPDSRGSMRSSERISVMPSHDMTSSTRTSPKKRRVYHGVSATTSDPYGTSSQADRDSGPSHGRNRSLSEYVPEAISIPPHRNVVVSGSGGPPGIQTLSPPDQPLHREEYLAVQRGLALAVARPPTPPRSNRSGAESDEGSSPVSKPRRPQKSLPIYFEARTVKTNKKRSWRAIRQLGKGTFSEVMLATSQGERRGQKSDRVEDEEIPLNEEQLDPRTLIAVKIIEHGPAGGASAERVATSLKRELDILLSIHHPSLVHLKAFSLDPQQALLVLNYCPGGDLFELASLKHDLLVPALIQRIFAELVAAVRYLHEQYIVHRDIKLESRPPICLNV